MDFQLTEAQQQLQRDVVAYLERHVTPALEAELLAQQTLATDPMTDAEFSTIQRLVAERRRAAIERLGD